MEFVAFWLTAGQLAELHDFVLEGMEHLTVSRVDIVVGVLARCLSEVEPESKPIDTVSYTVNHRGMGIYPDNAVLNAIIWPSTELQVSRGIDLRDSVLAWVIEIRKSLGRLKDPRFIKDMVVDLAKRRSQVAWDKGMDFFMAKGGPLRVNSMWKFGWTSAHFGHPGKVRFYHEDSPRPRLVKIITPNPKFVDGTLVSREGDMEVTLYVPQNGRKMFEELFDKYTKSLGMTGSVEFAPSPIPRQLKTRL